MRWAKLRRIEPKKICLTENLTFLKSNSTLGLKAYQSYNDVKWTAKQAVNQREFGAQRAFTYFFDSPHVFVDDVNGDGTNDNNDGDDDDKDDTDDAGNRLCRRLSMITGASQSFQRYHRGCLTFRIRC